MRPLPVLLLLLVACEKKVEAPPKPLFQADRPKACEAFAKRVSPSMRGDRLPVDQSIAQECETSGRVHSGNVDCLLSAKSADGVGVCFDGGVGERLPAAGCALYAKHVAGLMATELGSAMRDACLSPQMKEATFDCVMAAKSDPEFKHCLGLAP